MSSPTSSFPHLQLVFQTTGRARLGGGGKKSPETEAAKANRQKHSTQLSTEASALSAHWKGRLATRASGNLPLLPAGVPVLLEIDPSLDIEELRHLFGFEIVAEHEDGFVIIAASDLDFRALLQKANDFTGEIRGSAGIAKIRRLLDAQNVDDRLDRIIPDPRLRNRWPLDGDKEYVVEVGIACGGLIEIPSRPNPPNRGKRESERVWAKREKAYAEKLSAWTTLRATAYEAWDNLRDERYDEFRSFVEAYSGEVLAMFESAIDDTIPGSFTVRIKSVGRAILDIALNYPYLFELVEPDEIETPQCVRDMISAERQLVDLLPPEQSDPSVCIIDSGIQEDHLWIESALDRSASRSFLPGEDDVSDHVRPGGHGTRVAGAVLYGDKIPRSGQHKHPCWIQNARVLDEHCSFPTRLFPPNVLQGIVQHFHTNTGERRRTRIFNHSISGSHPCRLIHMSSWAAEIDLLTHNHDILFIQCCGNIYCESTEQTQPGVREHLLAGRDFPEYLCENSSRVANPAQSLNALTVGSVAHTVLSEPDWNSVSTTDSPSAFSRSGFGIWQTIKPEVVEFGGDYIKNGSGQITVGTPSAGEACYPELLRSTLIEPGPAYARDEVGTSYSTPKVARIAALLERELPRASCLLYKALIVQSARWPQWAVSSPPEIQSNVIRWMGYGLPNAERAVANTPYRTTLILPTDRHIGAGECHVFQVPIPSALRRPGDDIDILLEVTLTYSAPVRRTRRNLRRYLSTWVDWKVSKAGEPIDAFCRRVLKDTDDEPAGESEGTLFRWAITSKADRGTVRGVKRNAGTTQKDWAIVSSNSLPERFCVAVMGHEGWSQDPDAKAKYSLVVSIEVLSKEIEIYEPLRAAVEELEAQLHAGTELEVDVQIPDE